MNESFDDIIREYIDFVNQQVGVYMDALGGFAGNCARVERQVHRVNRRSRIQNDGGKEVVVWASYEDPTKPDIIHNRIARASEYMVTNADGGFNEQQHARGIIIFLFAYWEDEIRPRLARATRVETNDIRSDIMGDLRILRHVILHEKGIVRPDKFRRLTKLREIAPENQPLQISYEDMHRLFVLIKQDLAQLLFEWLGVRDAPMNPGDIRDIAIQKR